VAAGLANGLTSAGLSHDPPRRIVVIVPAAGVAITSTSELLCTGRVPGTFSVQMVVPQFVRFTLAAAGTGAAAVRVGV